jgi:hypothetical protein
MSHHNEQQRLPDLYSYVDLIDHTLDFNARQFVNG